MGNRRPDDRVASRSLRLAALMIAGVSTGAVAACAPTPSPTPTSTGGGAEESITAFVEALSDGAFADALQMSTAAASDFACASMVANGSDIAMAAPEVHDVEVDGERATAQVSYYTPDEQSESFDLVLKDGAWLVELPESFEIAIGFDAPVVADVVIDKECRVPVEGSALTTLAWPGLYRVDIVDPSGVLERERQMLYAVPGASISAGAVDSTALPAVDDGSLTVLRGDASEILAEALTECVAAGMTGTPCPLSLRDVSPVEGARPTGDSHIIDRVWTDDGRHWQFESKPGAIEAVLDGRSTQVEFTYSGTLLTDGAGELRVQFSG